LRSSTSGRLCVLQSAVVFVSFNQWSSLWPSTSCIFVAFNQRSSLDLQPAVVFGPSTSGRLWTFNQRSSLDLQPAVAFVSFNQRSSLCSSTSGRFCVLQPAVVFGSFHQRFVPRFVMRSTEYANICSLSLLRQREDKSYGD
jgi:hypothetical protein